MLRIYYGFSKDLFRILIRCEFVDDTPPPPSFPRRELVDDPPPPPKDLLWISHRFSRIRSKVVAQVKVSSHVFHKVFRRARVFGAHSF